MAPAKSLQFGVPKSIDLDKQPVKIEAQIDIQDGIHSPLTDVNKNK